MCLKIEWTSHYVVTPTSNKVFRGRIIPRPPSMDYSSLLISTVNVIELFAYYLNSACNY